MASLEVNVTQGPPTVPRNRFLSHFISLLSPSTLLKRPRSKALWEVARRPVGMDIEGWWGEEFPRSASIKKFWLKPHPFLYLILSSSSSYLHTWHPDSFFWQDSSAASDATWHDWDAEKVRKEHMHCHSMSWELSERNIYIWRKNWLLFFRCSSELNGHLLWKFISWFNYPGCCLLVKYNTLFMNKIYIKMMKKTDKMLALVSECYWLLFLSKTAKLGKL